MCFAVELQHYKLAALIRERDANGKQKNYDCVAIEIDRQGERVCVRERVREKSEQIMAKHTYSET